jgi:aspartyl-tRNA(Asn)/glutamyl-tRNA(Gln) amidotransferase subunit A
MTTDDLGFSSGLELARAVRERQLSPVEIVSALLQRIEALNPRLNAFVEILGEQALAAARRAEQAVTAGGELPLLHGVPVVIKDQINIEGVKVTFGTALMAGQVATEDAPTTARLRAAGAIILGTTTMPEFGWQGISWSPLYGMTRNPWNLEGSAGGSSSGSAAAVAAGLSPLAVGSDGAGSIRIPASFCGVFGLKPTFGRVPMYPVSASELVTHYGPITRSVADAAAMLDVLSGPDPRDPFCLPAANESFLAGSEASIAGLKLAWSPDLGYAKVDPEVARLTAAAAKRFAGLGCLVEEATPGFDDPIWAADQYLTAGMANRASGQLEEMRDRMDPSFVTTVETMATRTLFDSANARLVRYQVADVMGRFFQKYDLLLTPTMAAPAFGTDRSETPYQPSIGWSPFTYPFNLTGEPAATVPCGFTSDGLPVGLQIVGPRFADSRVLAAARAFEAAQPWSHLRPPVA